jgi:hypothetical protein
MRMGKVERLMLNMSLCFSHTSNKLCMVVYMTNMYFLSFEKKPLITSTIMSKVIGLIYTRILILIIQGFIQDFDKPPQISDHSNSHEVLNSLFRF